MERLDELVIAQFEERILSPERLEKVVATLIQRQQGKNNDTDNEALLLNRELRETQKKIDRLYDALGEGVIDNTADFQAAVSRQKQRKDELIRQISAMGRRRDIPKDILSFKNVKALAVAIHNQLGNPDKTFRKNYLRLFVDRVEVDDGEIRIFGPKSALVQGLMAAKMPDTRQVPSFDTEWWWTQSRANPSPPKFPVKQGKYREFSRNRPKSS